MKHWHIIFVGLLFFVNGLRAQTSQIEGRLLDPESKEPIPFANIYNHTLKKGTLSNTQGYFRLDINNFYDDIKIRSIGFKEHTLVLKENKLFYEIKLEENLQFVNEVTISPANNAYLVDLVESCKKTANTTPGSSKAIYELKSFVNDSQIELVEAYYNAYFNGYELSNLQLKTGRVALQPYMNRFFASLESSRAILMLKLLDKNEYFPKGPLELAKNKFKKKYYLWLDKKYVDNSGDSIYIVSYKPKDSTGLFFEGKLWLNKSQLNIVKINLNCKNSRIHPFLPLFPSDSIKHVNFSITKTFNSFHNQMNVNHIDFIYTVEYKSRIGKSEETAYTVKTKAVLYLYDKTNVFILPEFNFSDNAIADYRKINALPYSDFFWKHNNEYNLNDSLNSNDLFFGDSLSVTNKTLFKSNAYSKKGLFEHPYIHWSEKRIAFRDLSADTAITNSTGFKANQYNIAVKLFADVNAYNDSIHVVTATILDPFESFYHLPITNLSHCFINIYFDLCEIERRKLEIKLNAVKNQPEIFEKTYNDFVKNTETMKAQYFKSVERGKNEKELQKYNNYVMKELGINNIELFQLDKKE